MCEPYTLLVKAIVVSVAVVLIASSIQMFNNRDSCDVYVLWTDVYVMHLQLTAMALGSARGE